MRPSEDQVYWGRIVNRTGPQTGMPNEATFDIRLLGVRHSELTGVQIYRSPATGAQIEMPFIGDLVILHNKGGLWQLYPLASIPFVPCAPGGGESASGSIVSRIRTFFSGMLKGMRDQHESFEGVLEMEAANVNDRLVWDVGGWTTLTVTAFEAPGSGAWSTQAVTVKWSDNEDGLNAQDFSTAQTIAAASPGAALKGLDVSDVRYVVIGIAAAETGVKLRIRGTAKGVL